jgi:hypothetical protein
MKVMVALGINAVPIAPNVVWLQGKFRMTAAVWP